MVQAMPVASLHAVPRSLTGSRRVRRLRQDGWLPAVVYDAQGQSQPIQFQRHAFEMFLRRRAGENVILDLEIDGRPARKVLLKAVQRDPVRDHLTHVDLFEISMTRKLRVPVAVRLVGDPVGVTQQGGVLEHLLRAVEVECLPADLIKELVLDVAGLSIGDSLFVRDLHVDTAKMAVLTAPDIAVAAVLAPHVEEEAKPAEEAAAEAAAQPEAAGEAKAGEAAGEAAAGKDKGAAKGKDAAPKSKEAEAKPEKSKDAKGKGRE